MHTNCTPYAIYAQYSYYQSPHTMDSSAHSQATYTQQDNDMYWFIPIVCMIQCCHLFTSLIYNNNCSACSSGTHMHTYTHAHTLYIPGVVSYHHLIDSQ